MLVFAACGKQRSSTQTDSPRLTDGVVLRDVTFHSAALARDMPYRVILPAHIGTDEKLPVVYLLHGGGGGFRDWSNYSDAARFAERGLILVMPEGESSYYVNAVDRPKDRFEDYIVKDLIADAETRLPIASDREHRAIAGVSMGGFGAVNLALKHADLFAFAGGLSAALDVPSRPFSIKRLEQWRRFRAIFGPWGGQVQHDNDPFLLARAADADKTPYFYLASGEQEGLLPVEKAFASLLQQRHLSYEFHTAPGGHDWNQWNAQLAGLFESVRRHLEPGR